MPSVTTRIKNYPQPYGGYIPPKTMLAFPLTEDGPLHPKENIAPNLVGLAVDYLTRYQMGTKLNEAFKISLLGSFEMKMPLVATDLIIGITGLDDRSIINACQLVGFDTAYRAGPHTYQPVEEILPDAATIENIRRMVERSQVFFEKFGPIVKDGFAFKGGYTDLIDSGDGDFLTEAVLWDFKVLRGEPNKNHTLQLLVYYLMGLRSKQPEFETIEQLGIYNPRLNKVYVLNILDIPATVIAEVSRNVIGY